MNKVCFVSTNKHKFDEILPILQSYGIDVEYFDFFMREIQTDSIEEIALEKSRNAFEILKRPVIVEDTGIFINSLNGFPGPYSSYVFKTIGNKGILNLLLDSNDRRAYFKSIISFTNGMLNLSFSGEMKGTIKRNISRGGWGYDPIFIPLNCYLTYGQLALENKIKISHRTQALTNFVKWFIDNQQNIMQI